MLRDFKIIPPDLAGYKVLLAVYEYVYYEGEAFVLLINQETNTLNEINGSHCSCYGLEGQWEPEETSAAALRYRIVKGNLGQIGEDNFTAELLYVLDAYETLHDEIENGEADQLVVVAVNPNIGYFTVEKEDRTDFLPDLPETITSTCVVYDQKTVRRWIEEESTYDINNNINRLTTFTLNPVVSDWKEEGFNHQIEEHTREDNPTLTMTTIYREREIECKRVNVGTIRELAQWLKDNNGYVVDGDTNNILEDKIIEVYL